MDFRGLEQQKYSIQGWAQFKNHDTSPLKWYWYHYLIQYIFFFFTSFDIHHVEAFIM